MFFWQSITALDLAVVPDVNSKIVISSGSMVASVKVLSPAASFSSPIFRQS